MLGERVALTGDAQLDASGELGGGRVLVGGDFQGKNPEVQNARSTYVGANASIKADATENGDWGKVVVGADDTTRYYGGISAQGGREGGDGGNVEVSGKRRLDFNGRVALGAAKGKSGALLLDPLDIVIQGGAAAQPNDGDLPFSFDTDPTDTYQISEGALEAITSGTVTLEARRNISTQGSFDNPSGNTGDGVDTLAFANNVSVVMRTRNAATSANGDDGSGSIDLSLIHLKTSGSGSITLEVGSGASGNEQGRPVHRLAGRPGTGSITLSAGGRTLLPTLAPSPRPAARSPSPRAASYSCRAVTTLGGDVLVDTGTSVVLNSTITTTAAADSGVKSGDVTITAVNSITVSDTIDTSGASRNTGTASQAVGCP